jgi:PAS domain S-box-containing protein
MPSANRAPGEFSGESEALRIELAELERSRLEYEQAKQALHESEARYRSLFDGVPVGLYRTNIEGEFLEINPAMLQMLGFTKNQPLEDIRTPDLYVDPADRGRWQSLLEEYGTLLDFETQLRRQDGTLIWVRDNARALRDSSGNVTSYEGSIKDITGRKLAEQMASEAIRVLEKQNQRLDSLYRVGQIVNSTLDVEVILDHLMDEAMRVTQASHGQVLLVNKAAGSFERRSLRGFSEPEAERAFLITLPLDQGINGRAYLMHETVLVDDVQQEPNYFQLIAATRTELAVPILHHGEVLGNLDVQSPIIGAFHDLDIDYLRALAEQVSIALSNARLYQQAQQEISERRRIEAELNRLMDVLARSNEELEQFAYVASHDLQEPLRMVTSFLQLLKSRYHSKLDSDADEFIDFAVDGATRMKTLINDLLIYSRVGTASKPYLPISGDEVFNRATANLRVVIAESGAKVTHDPLPVILADDTQIVQLFQNLIGNALKFRSDRAPHIHVGVETKGDQWVFSFKDNGIGIEPEYKERIFIIFQRLHLSTDYPGTGIGLAVCKKIVERHGGKIWVESEPGQGATFCFTLPVIKEQS